QRAGASTRWQASAFSVDTHDAIKRFAATDFKPVELEWRVVDGKGYVLALDALARSRLLAANSTEPAAEPFARFEMGMLQSIVTRWFPNNKVTEATVLTEYDTYYYSREAHTMSGGSSKPLPVLRVKFDDANATWLHLDPYTGATLNQLDSHRRVGRWLFAFLHSFDWLPLLNNRPVWDFWMILISIGGFVTSVTGIVIGWRRLRQKVAST
ncbi:MAG TPA: PepSY domain-containing protein, partial [Casimicrobium sp.]|nr:PepSY domain-containing protein [Casimicrobium sp.]